MVCLPQSLCVSFSVKLLMPVHSSVSEKVYFPFFCFWKLSDINDKVVLNSAAGFILGASFFGIPRRRKGTQRFLCGAFWNIFHFLWHR